MIFWKPSNPSNSNQKYCESFLPKRCLPFSSKINSKWHQPSSILVEREVLLNNDYHWQSHVELACLLLHLRVYQEFQKRIMDLNSLNICIYCSHDNDEGVSISTSASAQCFGGKRRCLYLDEKDSSMELFAFFFKYLHFSKSDIASMCISTFKYSRKIHWAT